MKVTYLEELQNLTKQYNVNHHVNGVRRASSTFESADKSRGLEWFHGRTIFSGLGEEKLEVYTDMVNCEIIRPFLRVVRHNDPYLANS